MIVEYIRYALKNHTPKEFIAAYIEGGYHLGCVRFNRVRHHRYTVRSA